MPTHDLDAFTRIRLHPHPQRRGCGHLFRRRVNRPPQVTFRSNDSTNEEIVLQILDNRAGPDQPGKPLFVPFYTTRPNGSDIRPVLAPQIAAAHKGSLTVSNRSDTQGCTAELRLPAATNES